MTPAASEQKPWIAIVGGFLGAGKTTLILAAAKELERRGIRSAVILNDQGNELVDTGYATQNGMQSGEVTGGCFCCKLSDLLRVIEELRAYQPAVIFAEPVGSCTDISATILHPLLEYRDEFRLAPFTVLVDPERARTLLSDDADPDLSFLFHKQLQEADLVCWTKSDLYPDCPQVSAQYVRQVSARTGQGVAAWLDEIFSGNLRVGGEILDIDYEQYARAEAALAWLNLQVTIEPSVPRLASGDVGSAARLCRSRIHREPCHDCAPEGHHRFSHWIPESRHVCQWAGARSRGSAGRFSGIATPPASEPASCWFGATGSRIVERELDRIDGKLIGLHIDCFHPSAPNPESRVAEQKRL